MTNMLTIACVCGGVGETALAIAIIYAILGFFGIHLSKKHKHKHCSKEHTDG